MSSIGTALFGKIALESFNRLSGDISDLQARISSGKNDPRPSADPMRAAKLSAVAEQRGAIDRFTENATLATDRLGQADLAMGEVANIVRQFQQISIQAANDTLTSEGIAGLRAEAQSLRTALKTAANTSDTMGLPLFAGFGSTEPFTEGPAGVVYRGDGGRPALRLSETATLTTGLNGSEVFMSVPSQGDAHSLFDMVDDLIATLSLPLQPSRPRHTVSHQGMLTPAATRDPATLSFDLTGPDGTTRISAEVMKGAPAAMLDAINAATPHTGVTARLAPDGDSFILESRGDIAVANLSQPDAGRAPVATLIALDQSFGPKGVGVTLRNEVLSADRMVGAFGDAVGHIAAQRAEVGALARLAEDNGKALADRRLRVDQAMAGLEDLDVAAAITRLQTLLLTEQAAQQSFVKINSTSLFDYLR
jgi:flagellar hook-associated protein 3 FlgL